jgi:hypothetical protein
VRRGNPVQMPQCLQPRCSDYRQTQECENSSFGTLRKTKGSLCSIFVSQIFSVLSCDESIPHSNASKTKAATSNLQAADPPSVGASPCPITSPFGTSCSVSYGVDESDLSSFCAMASVGCGNMTVVSSISPIARDMMVCKDRVRIQSKMLDFLKTKLT